MLKKVTIISVFVLIASMLVCVVAAPLAVKDFLTNGDKIFSQFFNASEVYSFEEADAIRVDFPGDYYQILVEQSEDDNSYLRVEGVMAKEYTITPREETIGSSQVVTVRIGDDSFFDPDTSSYLLRRSLRRMAQTTVILRVPERVAVETTGRPYYVYYNDSVRFANRSYYDDREWEENTEYESGGDRSESRRALYQKYDAGIAAFGSELETASARMMTQVDVYPTENFYQEVDGIVERYQQKLRGQLFPLHSEIFDIDTLSSLLNNYLELVGQEEKYRTVIDLDRGDESTEEQYDKVSELAGNARERFEEMYERYLDDAAPAEEGEDFASSEAEPAGMIVQSEAAEASSGEMIPLSSSSIPG